MSGCRSGASTTCRRWASESGSSNSAEGSLYVLNAEADELEVVHSAEFEEELFATPAVLDGTVYLRTTKTLWAFGSNEG